jgi:hypothetical protein
LALWVTLLPASAMSQTPLPLLETIRSGVVDAEILAGTSSTLVDLILTEHSSAPTTVIVLPGYVLQSPVADIADRVLVGPDASAAVPDGPPPTVAVSNTPTRYTFRAYSLALDKKSDASGTAHVSFELRPVDSHLSCVIRSAVPSAEYTLRAAILLAAPPHSASSVAVTYNVVSVILPLSFSEWSNAMKLAQKCTDASSAPRP